MNHRHLKPASASSSGSSTAPNTNPVGSSHAQAVHNPRDPRAHLHVDVSHQQQQPMIGHIPHTQVDHPDHARGASVPMGSPVGQIRQYPHSPASYQTSIPVSSARPNLITVPIQDDGAGQVAQPPAHMPHPQQHAPPPQQYPPTVNPLPPANYYQQHPNPNPAYSQAPPPMATQTFSQPPPSVHQLQRPSGPIYSAPPPATYTPPRGPHNAPRPMFPPPQSGPENPPYMQQWNALPPRPITAPPLTGNPNVGHLQPRGPSDPGYRQPYYHNQ